jgi:hypothetical protein
MTVNGTFIVSSPLCNSLHQSLTSEPTGLTLRNLPGVGIPSDYLLEYDVPVGVSLTARLRKHSAIFEAAAALQSD